MHLGVIPAPALGDGILAMVLAHNAHRVGCTVTVHHDALVGLRARYPWARIEPATDATPASMLAGLDALFVGDPAHADLALAEGTTVVFGKGDWDRDHPYLLSLRAVCAPAFGLADWSHEPGILRPEPSPDAAGVVALHPTSANPAKDWPAARWRALARRLRAAGHEPAFLVAPADEDAWRAHAEDAAPVVVPGPLEAVAAWLAGTSGCIATDSGIAHLASALDVPTLAIFRKASAARFWAPAWGRSGWVSAPWRLPGGGGHRLWARLLSPARVLRHYEALRAAP